MLSSLSRNVLGKSHWEQCVAEKAACCRHQYLNLQSTPNSKASHPVLCQTKEHSLACALHCPIT